MVKKVVVVGGGYAGVEAAKACDKAFDVTLVAGRDKFLNAIAGMRASVVSGYSERVLIPYDKVLKRGTVVHVEARRINETSSTVTLSNGEELPYDFLVLATGFLHPNTVGWAGGESSEARMRDIFEESCRQVARASQVLIIGGGAIGIEMAGEIRDVYPDKKITLVTSDQIVPSPHVSLPETLRRNLARKLKSSGVEFFVNVGRVSFDMADVNKCGYIVGNRSYRWAGGEVEADLCIVATGQTQARNLYTASGLTAWLDERGRVMVNESFEVVGAGDSGKIFAVGDCNNSPVPKLAYVAGLCGAAVAKSIQMSSAGMAMKNVVPSPPAVCIVPYGKRGGVSALPGGIVCSDFVTRYIKASDLFAGKFWAALNAGKPPKAP